MTPFNEYEKFTIQDLKPGDRLIVHQRLIDTISASSIEKDELYPGKEVAVVEFASSNRDYFKFWSKFSDGSRDSIYYYPSWGFDRDQPQDAIFDKRIILEEIEKRNAIIRAIKENPELTYYFQTYFE